MKNSKYDNIVVQWRSQDFFELGDNLNFSYIKKSSLQSFKISSVNSNPRGGDLSPDHPTRLRHCRSANNNLF